MDMERVAVSKMAAHSAAIPLATSELVILFHLFMFVFFHSLLVSCIQSSTPHVRRRIFVFSFALPSFVSFGSAAESFPCVLCIFFRFGSIRVRIS